MPDLVLAQTCGFPYRAKLHHHVTLTGTPATLSREAIHDAYFGVSA